jgi:hypothetical protein
MSAPGGGDWVIRETPVFRQRAREGVFSLSDGSGSVCQPVGDPSAICSGPSLERIVAWSFSGNGTIRLTLAYSRNLAAMFGLKKREADDRVDDQTNRDDTAYDEHLRVAYPTHIRICKLDELDGFD